MIWQLVLISVLSYLIGSINLSIILSKALGKGDIREQGSGNAGTTNALRVLGKGPAALVLIFDALKGVISILLAKLIILIGVSPDIDATLLNDLAICLSGFFAIIGHNFPIYYGFKGGKGVATSLGVLLMIEWKIGLICLVFALVIIILSRMVSLGSILAAILYPVLVLIQGTAINNKIVYLIFAIILAALVLVRHRANIKRLAEGTENKLWGK